MYNIKLKIRGCKRIGDLGKFIKANNIKLVLFGEYHGFVNQDKVQSKIINAVKPDFFLYELLEEDKIFNDKEAGSFLKRPNRDSFSVVSTYGDLKPIVRLARNFNLPIIGCDIKNMGVRLNWKKKKFSNEEKIKITKRREYRQFSVLNKYSSRGLVFGLFGVSHLRRRGLILSKLKGKGIVINPLFKWNERFNNSKRFKDSEISYVVKLI